MCPETVRQSSICSSSTTWKSGRRKRRRRISEILLMALMASSIVAAFMIQSVECQDLKHSGKLLSSRGENDVIEDPTRSGGGSGSRSGSQLPPVLQQHETEEYDDYPDTEYNLEDFPESFEEDDHDKMEISKCCSPGEALDAEGECRRYPPEFKFDKHWYPDKYLDPRPHNGLMHLNISAWNITSPFRKTCEPGTSLQMDSDMDRFILVVNGELFVAHLNEAIPPLQFCYDQQIGKDAKRVVMACFTKEELGISSQSLRKCCYQRTMLELHANGSGDTCVLPAQGEEKNITGNWNLVHEAPKCEYGYSFLPIRAKDSFSVTPDGSFVLNNGDVTAPYSTYCVDYMRQNGTEPSLHLLQCLPHSSFSTENYGLEVTLGVFQIISAICLALAAVILTKLPELRSLHGKCQLTFLGTLFVLFVLMATARLADNKLPASLCVFVAVAIHCFALSSFFWLSLLCVNIYCRLRSIRPPLAPSRAENCRLFILCVFGWGLPAAFCAFLYVLDGTPKLNTEWAPQYGQNRCFIANKTAEVWYILVPVGLLLLGNGILFCLTAKELLCGIWRLENSDSINFRSKSMGIVVGKLGILMGIGWILDVASWALGPHYKHYFYTADVYNSLQGVFIFLAIVWRKRVLEVLHIRKPSIIRDDTMTGRPFLHHKHSNLSQTMTLTNGDQDVSLISAQDT